MITLAATLEYLNCTAPCTSTCWPIYTSDSLTYIHQWQVKGLSYSGYSGYSGQLRCRAVLEDSHWHPIHEQWSVPNLHGQWQLFHWSSSFWDTWSILPAEQVTRKWIIYRIRQRIIGSSSPGTKRSDQNHQQMTRETNLQPHALQSCGDSWGPKCSNFRVPRSLRILSSMFQ